MIRLFQQFSRKSSSLLYESWLILQKHRRPPGSDGSVHRFCAVLYVVRFYVRREISVEV
jgi:hypothetical protein